MLESSGDSGPPCGVPFSVGCAIPPMFRVTLFQEHFFMIKAAVIT